MPSSNFAMKTTEEVKIQGSQLFDPDLFVERKF